MELAQLFALAFFAYLAVGLIVALAIILSKGLSIIDPVTRDSGVGFKMLTTPGICTLWPWMLRSWIKAKKS